MAPWPVHRVVLLVVALGALAGTGPQIAAQDKSLALVPWPRDVKVAAGTLELTGASRVTTTSDKLLPLAKIVAEEIFLTTGLRCEALVAPARDGDIELAIDPKLKGEAHTLTVADRATIIGANYNAVALGTTTLIQALQSVGGKVALPHLTITDRPHFPYCGAMLDLARKPHSIATLKQCVEACRFYKIRTLHFHLTDENAWVFPSTAFPKLGTQNFAYAGGKKPEVYNLAELKELVAYADARGVTLVPELEMPGHSGQLRGAYPEIFGFKDNKGKTVTLGVINMIREEAFQALDTLVGEMAAVFQSSPYFHIGSDESSLGGMETMPEVKEFMARHKLRDVHDVFNLFVHRMNGIVKKHGKRMIVWEGAPVGPKPLPKDIIFMPWVGGAGTAAGLVKQGYTVINPPWGVSKPYFDPFLINGAQLARDEPLLMGATSILWEAPEEAALPYLRETGALRNEPTYNPHAGKNYEDFLRRLARTDARLDRLLHGFTFMAEGTVDPHVYMRLAPAFAKSMTATLQSSRESGQVRFTLDGTEPTVRSPAYQAPLKLTRMTTLKAKWFSADGKTASPTFTREYRKAATIAHDVVGAKVTISPDQPGYFGPGPRGLTDGFLADGDEPGSLGWVGWENHGKPIEINIDLGKPTTLKVVAAHCLRSAGGIALPKQVEVFVAGADRQYRSVAKVTDKTGAGLRGWFHAQIEPVTARYLRLRITHGADWVFVDEVAVNHQLSEPTLRHAARGKPVKLAFPPSDSYAAPGVAGLTNGYVNRTPSFLNLDWLGFDGKNFDAAIDLGKVQPIHEVGANFLQMVGGGIHVPRTVDVFLSDDGKEYRKAATIQNPPDNVAAYLKTLRADLKGARARHVRIVAHTNGQWLFIDEVFVNPEADVSK